MTAVIFLLSTISVRTLAANTKTEIIVSAAMSMKDALSEIAGKYETNNPRTKIVLNFGGSGQLRAQIEAGAGADIFIPATEDEIGKIQKLLEPDSKAMIASNTLVIIANKKSAVKLSKMEDLCSPAIKTIAIGNPDTVASGGWGKKAFSKKGIYEKLTPKFIYGENVRQVASYAAMGETDLGIAFLSDAIATPQTKVVYTFPKNSTGPIKYFAAITAASGKKAQAKKFIKFLQTENSKSIFKKHGFTNG